MAVISAQIDKTTARRALAQIVVGPDRKTVGYRTYTAASGTTTTAVIDTLSGIGADYVLALPWCVNLTDIPATPEFRRAISLSSSTVAFANAFTNAVAASDVLDFYPWRPSIYTTALNQAVGRVWPGIYRYLTSHVIVDRKDGSGSLYSLPRNMRRAHRVVAQGSTVLRDMFDRADSTTDPGNGWTNASGDTLGISSEQLYSAGGANGDYATQPSKIRDGYIEFTVEGTPNHATVYRIFSLMFRHGEDRSSVLDHNNYLVVRILNGVVTIRKVDGGTESSLTTATVTTADGTRYVIGVEFIGARIRVWVDDIQLIDYELTGLNLKFANNAGRWGFREDYGSGSPASASRVSDVHAFGIENPYVWDDWSANRDNQVIELPAYGGTRPSGLLSIEGSAPLTLFGTDNVESLATETTAVLEMLTTDPAWHTFLEAARACFYEDVGFTDLAEACWARYRDMPKMEQPQRRLRSVQVW